MYASPILLLTDTETAALAALNAGQSLPHRKSLVRYVLPYLSHVRSHRARLLASEWGRKDATPEARARLERGLPAPARPFTCAKYPGRACVFVTGWRKGVNFGAQRTMALDSLDVEGAA